MPKNVLGVPHLPNLHDAVRRGAVGVLLTLISNLNATFLKFGDPLSLLAKVGVPLPEKAYGTTIS